MIEKVLPIILLIIALFFEVSITSLPLLVGVLIFLAVSVRKDWVFLAAFLIGLIFDILTLRTIGTTSLFFTILIFLIFSYENKFEIATLPFIFISTFLFSFLFLIFLGFGNLLLQSLTVSILTLLLFKFSTTFRVKIS